MPSAIHGAPARAVLATVYLAGSLFPLLGSVLPVWGYHRLDAFLDAGNHFLLVGLGYLVANVVASLATGRSRALVFSPLPGAVLALIAILLFVFLPPPFHIGFQWAGAFAVGLAIGSLGTTLWNQLGAMLPLRSSASFQLTSGFGLMGAIVTPLAVAMAVDSVSSTALLVLLPAPILVGIWAGFGVSSLRPANPSRSIREAIDDFRNPPAILLALLLFFQLGNEMALYGWLPVFLIQRLGVSPATGLYCLAAFSLALLTGRVIVQSLRHRPYRNRIVFVGLFLAVLGSLMLTFTNNLFGVWFGVALVGMGFSPVYLVTHELIGNRFPYFHPGIFNSIFSIGLVGGMLAPWSVGLMAHWWGIQVLMVLPMLGAVMVGLLLTLTWVEAKLSGAAR